MGRAQVLGRGDLGKVMRAHLARLAPGARVRIHRDRGGYVDWGHRIHVPLQVRSRSTRLRSNTKGIVAARRARAPPPRPGRLCGLGPPHPCAAAGGRPV